MGIEKLKNLEEIGDYSIDLMHEISSEITRLSNQSLGDIEKNIEGINKKIDHARKKGLNVESLDKQFLDFRVTVFKRAIKHKIEDFVHSGTNYSTDISRFENEFEALKLESGVDFDELKKLMDDLKNEATRAQIRHKIECIIETGGQSAHSIESVTHDIQEAKEKGIRVDDLEDIIYG